MSILAQLSKNEMGTIAGQVIKSMMIGQRDGGDFDSVQIVYNYTDSSCQEFAFRIEEECWRVGAHTLVTPYSDGREGIRYKLLPEESLAKEVPLSSHRGRPLALVQAVDVTVFIGEHDDPAWASVVTDKLRIAAPIRTKILDTISQRGVRWLFFGWPIPAAARVYGMSVSRFRRIFFDSIRQSFSKKTSELISYYRSALSDGRHVRIKARDTDLSFSIEGRPTLVDDGRITTEDVQRGDVGLNIPTGEVFVAPLETTADGRITFDLVAIPGFGKVRNLQLTFEDGKITSFEAQKGTDVFRRFLDANTGEKDRVAEFGIGCNPGAEYTAGSIIIDEKIYKTIHVAIGFNTGAYHGVNKASSHLDMIKDMSKGEVIVDGKTIMTRGEPLRSSS